MHARTHAKIRESANEYYYTIIYTQSVSLACSSRMMGRLTQGTCAAKRKRGMGNEKISGQWENSDLHGYAAACYADGWKYNKA